MQQLLCESEDRLGSQASSSVVRPNSMIVQARRSALITSSGATRGGDGAEVIKASRARKNRGVSLFPNVLTQFCRHTLSFVGLTGLIFIVILLHFVPNSIIPRTRGTLTMTFQLRWVRCFLFLPTGIRSPCSHLLQPMVLLRMLLEIHCCVTRSMDRKSWTYARHSRSQGSRIRAPGRSAMSAQTRRSTRNPIPMVRTSPNEAVHLCARTKQLAKGVRVQCNFIRTCDDRHDHLTTYFHE
jgi:hypothetical protein